MNRKILKLTFTAVGLMLLFNLAGVNGQQSQRFETRCGWFSNPTPGNFSLYDKDREWIIGVQGGYQTEDFDAPVFKANQWIVTGTADYGYGCACFQMTVDKEMSRALEIKSSFAKPLSTCRKDKALKKWLSMLE